MERLATISDESVLISAAFCSLTCTLGAYPFPLDLEHIGCLRDQLDHVIELPVYCSGVISRLSVIRLTTVRTSCAPTPHASQLKGLASLLRRPTQGKNYIEESHRKIVDHDLHGETSMSTAWRPPSWSLALPAHRVEQ